MTRIYSTDTDAGTISVVERDQGGGHRCVQQIPVGNAPRGSVRITRDGRGYVSNCGGDTISEIDVINNREIARIKVGAAPRGIGIVPGERFALVSNSGANSVSVVDLHRRAELHQVAVGRDPRHMVTMKDGGAAYIAVWGSHYVSKLDLRPLQEGDAAGVREVERIHVPSGAHPYSLAIDPRGIELYVASTQSRMISVISVVNGKITAEIDAGIKGCRAIVFSPDGSAAFATIEDSSEVIAIDTVAREVIRRIDVGPSPRGIALDASDAEALRLYISCFTRTTPKTTPAGYTFAPNSLTVVELPLLANLLTGSVKYSEVLVGAGPCSVAILQTRAIAAST